MQRDIFTKVVFVVVVLLLVANLWTLLQQPAKADPSGQVQYKVVKF